MLPRTSLIRIQRSLYDRLRSQAKGLYGGLPTALKKYYTEYQRDFTGIAGFCTKSQLLADLATSDFILCGDYHTLQQSQKAAARLLRNLVESVKGTRQVIIALEMLKQSDTSVAKAYLDGRLTEMEFLKKISFRKRWGFHWAGYRKIFAVAEQEGLQIVGLSPKQDTSLHERDCYAAEALWEVKRAHPDAIVFTLVGDMHVARPHLPKALQKVAGNARVTVVHQNYDPYYWKLVDLGMEEFVEVIRISPDSYCLLNTPPWIKLQSHLSWLEMCSEGTKGLHNLDLSDEFLETAKIIAEFLGVTVREDFEVVGRWNREEIPFSNASRAERKLQSTYLQKFRSYYLPKQRTVYLSDFSINQLSMQAAIFIHASLSGFDRIFNSAERDFFAFLWVEALGFLGSKVVNLRRRCSPPEGSLQGDLQAHLQWEKHSQKANPLLRNADPLQAYEVAKYLGAVLGEAIYRALIEHKVTVEEVRELFHSRFDSPKENQSLYLKWIRRMDDGGFRELN